jgi:hypothetical protein
MMMKPCQIINKPKHPKQNRTEEGEYMEQNGRMRVQEDKKNQLRGRTTKGMSSSQSPSSEIKL